MTGTRNLERLGAVLGLTSIIAGGVGGALERGWPSPNAPADVGVFLAEHRAATLGQSIAFLTSALLTLWFVATLRAYLIRLDARSEPLLSIGFGVMVLWAGVTFGAHALQVGVTLAPPGTASSATLWTMAAFFGLTNLPLAIVLAVFAVVTWEFKILPAWLGWIAAGATVAQVLLFAGTFVTSGPLSVTGTLQFVLYPMFLCWLIPSAVILFRRAGLERHEQPVSPPLPRAPVPSH